MSVTHYATLFQRVQIITPRVIRFVSEEDKEAEEVKVIADDTQRGCAVCGAVLKENQKKLCSIACMAISFTAQPRTRINCKICKKSFIPSRKKQVCCGAKCGAAQGKVTMKNL